MQQHATSCNVMQGHARTAWCVDFTCKSLGHTTCLLHDDGPSGPIYVSLHPSHVVFGLVIWTHVVVIEIFDISYISYQKDPKLWLSRHAEKCRKSAGASSTRFRSSKDIDAERVNIRSQWSLRKSFINEMQKRTRLEHPLIWCAILHICWTLRTGQNAENSAHSMHCNSVAKFDRINQNILYTYYQNNQIFDHFWGSHLQCTHDGCEVHLSSQRKIKETRTTCSLSWTCEIQLQKGT